MQSPAAKEKSSRSREVLDIAQRAEAAVLAGDSTRTGPRPFRAQNLASLVANEEEIASEDVLQPAEGNSPSLPLIAPFRAK